MKVNILFFTKDKIGNSFITVKKKQGKKMKGTTFYIIYENNFIPKHFKNLTKAKKFAASLNSSYRIFDKNGKCILYGA